jgi:hypothetical protein
MAKIISLIFSPRQRASERTGKCSAAAATFFLTSCIFLFIQFQFQVSFYFSLSVFAVAAAAAMTMMIKRKDNAGTATQGEVWTIRDGNKMF